MATGAAFAGGGTIRIAGRIYNCTAIDVDPAESENEVKVGMNGTAGLKKTPKAPALTCTILITTGVKVQTLNDVEDETIEVRCIDGKSFSYGGASRTDPFTMDITEREASGAFGAMDRTERN